MADPVLSLQPEPAPPMPEAAEPSAPPVMYRGAPGTVAVIRPDGERSYVREEDLEAAQAEGDRIATREDMWATDEYGQIAAGAAGVARGLTFGLSDRALVEGFRTFGGEESAEEMRSALRGFQQNRGASVGGEIAGSLATLMVGLPPAAAAETTATSLVGRAAQRAAAASPRLFAEGAAMGAGHQVSEDALGDHEVVGENYVIEILKSGGANVLLGGVLVGAGGAFADRLALRSAAKAAESPAATIYRTAAHAETEAASAAKKATSPLARAAEEQALKGIGTKLKDWQKLGATVEAAEARGQSIGRTLIEQGISTPGASLSTQAKRLTKRVSEVGEDLGSIRKSLDRAAARPSAANVLQRLQSEVVEPLASRPFSRAEQRAVADYVEEIAKYTKGRETFESFDDLHRLRRELDTKLDPKLWSKVPGSAPPAAEELGKIRRVLEDEFEQAAERAAAELGEDIAQRYRVVKALFANLKTAEKIAVKETARHGANRAISLTDTIAAAAGFATLGPKGIALAAANKAVRQYGNQVAAHVLDRASRIDALSKASTAIEAKVKSAAKAFLKREKNAPKVSSSPAPDVRALRGAVRTPDAVRARVEESIRPIGNATPNVARAAAVTLTRAATYLAQNLPQQAPPPGPAFLPGKPPPLSATQRETAERMIRGATEPDAVIDAIASGRVSREEIEAFKHVFPRRFEHIRQEIARQAAEMKPELTIQQEAMLSVIFDLPVGQFTEPATVLGFQEVFANAAPGEGEGQQPMPKGAPLQNAGGKRATQWDRMEGGLE